jgi:tRNA-dihydrouridine synthase B
MKIGNIDLGFQPVLLAPMEDVTDPSFRAICKEYGADLMYTEFVSSDGLIRNAGKSIRKLEIYESERPIGIQIYGHLKDSMVEAAKLAEEAKPDLIDINFGCPMKKIARRGAGSGMMNDVPKMVDITSAVVKAVNLPVTVKTRLGYDDENKNIPEIAIKLQDVGIQALTIHGRTRSQLYKGSADWALIGEIKNNPKIHIPIIGNGDINSAGKAFDFFKKYGVDAIMIGRASIGKPWIFSEIKQFLKTGILFPEPTINNIVALAKRHFLKSIEFKGEKVGILEMRRHFVHYFKGLPDFREIRIQLLTSMNQFEIIRLLETIKEIYCDKNE